MKNIRVFFTVLTTLFAFLVLMPICADSSQNQKIYLYGESHGIKKILEKEFELWHKHYHTQGMRHLFLELPYYTAQFLNLWMKSDNNDILNQLYDDMAGTQACVPELKVFYENIKKQCPQTIFYGTDVGHQYDTTGARYLEYLKDKGLEKTEEYTLALKAVEQGKHYYSNKSDPIYRENKMTENFVQALGSLKGESIMGIYGSAHTDPEGMDNFTRSVPCMANQLKKQYKDALYTESLSSLALRSIPLRVDSIKIAEKSYKASYFGKQNMSGLNKNFKHREFWRLEDAYDDFKDMPKTGDVLPYRNFPMVVEKGQVIIIDYTRADDSLKRMYYRSDGNEWKKQPTTEEFKIK